MRAAEMRQREDFESVLCATLSRGWSQQFGRSIEVRVGDASGQAWRFQPLLSAFYVSNVSAGARRFLRDWFRVTAVRRRAPAQWLLGTMLASAAGLRATGRRGFWVVPGIERAEDHLVVPGNQRIRVFDFGTSCTRVFLKSGFSDRGFMTELSIRSGGRVGPFLPIASSDASSGWFEEPIVYGYALPRCPRALKPRVLAERALVSVEDWSKPTARQVSGRDHAVGLKDALMRELPRVPGSKDLREPIQRAAAELAKIAGLLDTVEVARVHGDFQPGNILVSRDGLNVTVIDWEHSSVRYRLYDRFVFGLATRSGVGLAERVGDFIAGCGPWPLAEAPRDRSQRSAMAAMFLLEDILWFVRESLAGPYFVPSLGLATYCEELRRLGLGSGNGVLG